MKSRLTRGAGVGLLLPMIFLFHFFPPLYGQNVSQIPQRVVFTSHNLQLSPHIPEEITDLLYASIAKRRALVRVYSESEAHSRVKIAIEERFGGGYDVEVELVHLEEGKKAGISAESGSIHTWEELLSFVETAAEEIAPELDPVSPEVRVVEPAETGEGEELYTFERSAETQEFIDAAKAEDLRASRWSYSVWLSGMRQHMLGDHSNEEEENKYWGITPVMLNLNYFPRRNFGYKASLFVHYDSVSRFGEAFDSVSKTELFDSDPATRNLFLLPGLGVQFRTLGSAYALAGVDFLGGAVFIENPNDYSIGLSGEDGFMGTEVVGPQSTAAYFYSYLSFHLTIGYHISPKYAIGMRTAVNVFPGYYAGIYEIDSYGLGNHSLFLHFFSFGFEYRP